MIHLQYVLRLRRYELMNEPEFLAVRVMQHRFAVYFILNRGKNSSIAAHSGTATHSVVQNLRSQYRFLQDATPYQGAQHARNVSINPMLFRASRSDMSNLTNCITNESVAVTADKKPVIGRIHSFESCGTVDGQASALLPFSRLPDALPVLP